MQLPPLTSAILIKRYKRFLADVCLPNGDLLTVHCPNTGAMTGCAEAGNTVWLSVSDNPKRKYPHTWELSQTARSDWIGIHSAKANALVEEAISHNTIAELAGYPRLYRERVYGSENSRIDFYLESDESCCFVEVKSVTLLAENGVGLFPDAVSERGRKHLRELIAVKQQGHRAVLLFCVQHTGIDCVAPADEIDAKYGDTLREAMAQGVEVLAYRTAINTQSITLTEPIPVLQKYTVNDHENEALL